MRKTPLLMLAVLLLAAITASATTILPVTDDALADQAAVVAFGTIISSGPAVSTSGRPMTEYRLRVDNMLKGDAPSGGTLVVRVLGGDAGSGLKLKIWGAPSFRIGERALLFLAPYADGSYGPLHLALGAFHELRTQTGSLAVRDLSEVYQGAGQQDDGVRDLGRFTHWLKDRADGVVRDADYRVPRPTMQRAWDEFTYLGGTRQRWLEFDQGQSVSWLMQASGQPGVPNGGFKEFQNAINAWNNDPATNIHYVYAGTTTNTTGFTHFDNQNVLILEDPNKEISGSFTCTLPGRGSGVLAVGGTWFDDSTTPATIGGADIITNDNTSCWFITPKRFEQVIGHELGHTLGLGHSCGDDSSGACDTQAKDDALMRANAHPDERGAQLMADDKAGILNLYPGGPGGGSGKPAAPSDLTGQAISSTEIELDWTDNSNNETQFIVQMKVGKKFKTVATVGADVTTVHITGLKPGTTYVFRVSAKAKKAGSAYSNNASVQTLH
jgi:hypothetical protein